MIFALVIVAVSGLTLFAGYKWGSHEATELAIKEFNVYERTQWTDGGPNSVGQDNPVLED